MVGPWTFEPTCKIIGKAIHCSIETDLEGAEFAFYVNLDGERKATFWYTNRCTIEYIFEDEIFNMYEIIFFIRIGGNKIFSKSITRKTNWSICSGVLEAIKNLVNKSSTIVEFGSGIGSKSLAEICTVFSIEHDERFLNLHHSVNYIHAPLVKHDELSEFLENSWYDSKIIKENIPEKIDLILVDGPPQKHGRSGLLYHLDMFDENSIWIVDDVLREKDQKLANYIALKFGHIQYRFWNFSILSSRALNQKVLDNIRLVSMKERESMSKHYLDMYYPTIELNSNTI